MIPQKGRVARAYKNRSTGLATKSGQRNAAKANDGEISLRQRDRRVIRAGLRKARPEMSKSRRVAVSRRQERALNRYQSAITVASGARTS